jgi:Transmembrane secretion effector
MAAGLTEHAGQIPGRPATSLPTRYYPAQGGNRRSLQRQNGSELRKPMIDRTPFHDLVLSSRYPGTGTRDDQGYRRSSYPQSLKLRATGPVPDCHVRSFAPAVPTEAQGAGQRVPITADQGEIRPVHRFGGLLRQRNFGLLWTGETISQAGNSMAVVGVPLLAVAVLHASTFAVSALTAAAYLPWLVIGLPAGAWVDRLPSRPLMIICDTVSALLYVSLPSAPPPSARRSPRVRSSSCATHCCAP